MIAPAVLPCESVHYRISAANRRSVCPPRCIQSSSATSAPSGREFVLGPGTRRAVPSLTRDARSAAVDASGIVPSRLLRDLAFASPCPHLETASAVLDDRPTLTNATVVAPARPPSSSTRIFGPPPSESAFRKHSFRNTISKHWHGMSSPVDATPSDLLRANVSHPVEPRSSPVVARAGFMRRRKHGRRSRNSSPGEQIETIDVDSRARAPGR